MHGGRTRKRVLSGIGKRRLARQSSHGREARKSDQRWEHILAGAARVFRRLGYANATLEDVACEVGIDRSTLYYYVATKAELLVAVLEEPIRGMTRDLRAIQELDLPPAEKIRTAIQQHMKALADNYPELFVFLAENLHLLPIGDERAIGENAQAYGDLMRAMIEEGVAAGEFRSDLDPKLAMLGIIGMCNWSHRWYRSEGPLSLAEIGRQFTDLALGGLLRRERGGSSGRGAPPKTGRGRRRR
ncbi:MAG: TetR/AcrR family transcriptional regulator [Candidatus Binatia bacterium]